jgi:hypothetical protein
MNERFAQSIIATTLLLLPGMPGLAEHALPDSARNCDCRSQGGQNAS